MEDSYGVRETAVKGPRVGEMMKLLNRRPEKRGLLAMTQSELAALTHEPPDEPTRMLAELLAQMTPGQRQLLRARLTAPP